MKFTSIAEREQVQDRKAGLKQKGEMRNETCGATVKGYPVARRRFTSNSVAINRSEAAHRSPAHPLTAHRYISD